MTISEFEKEIESIKECETNILNLKSFLYDLRHLGAKEMGKISFFNEENKNTTTITFDFPKKNISEMAEKYLGELKDEYKKAVERLNECGLKVECNKEILEY